MHRLITCGRGREIWKWTKARLVAILHTNPAQIPKEWLVRPQFHLRPAQKRRATLWILVHMFWFRTKMNPAISIHDYGDFFPRARWKAYQATGHSTTAASRTVPRSGVSPTRPPTDQGKLDAPAPRATQELAEERRHIGDTNAPQEEANENKNGKCLNRGCMWPDGPLVSKLEHFYAAPLPGQCKWQRRSVLQCFFPLFMCFHCRTINSWYDKPPHTTR
jgi:hypothetical protein